MGYEEKVCVLLRCSGVRDVSHIACESLHTHISCRSVGLVEGTVEASQKGFSTSISKRSVQYLRVWSDMGPCGRFIQKRILPC